MMRLKNGYTLTEVLMVVVIIGVLASMLMPRFMAQPERAAVAEASGFLGSIRQGEMAYRLDTNLYLSPSAASDWAKLGLDAPSGTKWTYTVVGGDPATAGTGTATAKRVGGDYDGKTVTLAIDGTWGGDHTLKPSN